MHCILRRVSVFIIIIGLSSIYIGCSETPKKDSTHKAPEQTHGGGCSH